MSHKRFRILFLGTPDFAVAPLRALLEDPRFEVVHVVSQPDRPSGRGMHVTESPVKRVAIENRVPVSTPEKVSDESSLEHFRGMGLDAAVVVAFGQILSQKFLDLFHGKVLNIHSSLLPRWRGAAPMQRALMAGDAKTGVTLQEIVLKLDAGDIVGTRSLDLTDDIDFPILYELLKNLSRELMQNELASYLKGDLKPHAQDETQVTIAKKIRKEEGLIDWSLPSENIKNAVRGLWPWPGTWTFREGKMLKIRRVKLSDKNGPPGQVVAVHKESFVVACGEGAIEIWEVQPESRSIQSSADYMRGRPIAKGEIFTSTKTS